MKARLHRGHSADLYHLRETRRIEVNLVVEAGVGPIAVEVKSGATVASDFFEGLRALGARDEVLAGVGAPILRLVYGGDGRHRRHGVEVVPWSELQEMDWF